MVDLAVVDYGINNLRSATRGLERAGAAVDVVETPARLDDADGVVLPGVGAFGDGMENAGPFRAALTDLAADGRPLLGICLGMQMLLSESEEAERAGQGDAEGLGLVPGRNVRFRDAPKVPHMGWNDLSVAREHPVLDGVDGEYAYFVHSYYAVPDDEAAVAATTTHGESFPSVVAADNVVGTQFHPEKSGETGLRVLENFVEFCAERRA
jgi:glutamine amidotransferase